MQVTKAINIELIDKSVDPLIYAKQNDSQTRFVAVSLFANGQPFDVPEGISAIFRAAKPDGTACFYDTNEAGAPAITIDGNLVTAELAEQVLTAAGNVYAEINLYSSSGEKLTTFSFVIVVEPSVLSDSEIVSSDYFNILTEDIAEVRASVSQAQNYASEAASSASAAAASAQQAETVLSSAVKSVNGVTPDEDGNVNVEAGVTSVFGRSGAVTAQSGDYTADQITESADRVFVSPQERDKWNAPGDLINGTLSVWQRYNSSSSATYTNPSNAYVADRFRANGTGTVKPNSRGYGADITGTITMQYWMEKTDFALLPDPVVVYYSVDGQMQTTSTAKSSVQTDSDGNACIFSQAITNQTLDWVSLYPGRPVRPYVEEFALCQRYYQDLAVTGIWLPSSGSAGTCYYYFPLQNNGMRVTPTAPQTASGAVFGPAGWNVTGTVSVTDQRLSFAVSNASGQTANTEGAGRFQVTLDAEIY